MADHPLKRLARLLGGVVLTQGRLPHQVLGQLMITNATSVEIAGANVVVAAASRQRGAVAQAAVRTAAPALAVHGVAQRQEKRLRRLADRVHDRERKLSALVERVHTERQQQQACMEELQRQQAQLEARAATLEQQQAQLAAHEADLLERRRRLEQAAERRAQLERDNEGLRAELEALRASAAVVPSPPPTAAPAVETPPAVEASPSNHASTEATVAHSSPRRAGRSSKKATRSKKKRSRGSARRGASSSEDDEPQG